MLILINTAVEAIKNGKSLLPKMFVFSTFIQCILSKHPNLNSCNSLLFLHGWKVHHTGFIDTAAVGRGVHHNCRPGVREGVHPEGVRVDPNFVGVDGDLEFRTPHVEGVEGVERVGLTPLQKSPMRRRQRPL